MKDGCVPSRKGKGGGKTCRMPITAAAADFLGVVQAILIIESLDKIPFWLLALFRRRRAARARSFSCQVAGDKAQDTNPVWSADWIIGY